jgi:hypothetical protein
MSRLTEIDLAALVENVPAERASILLSELQSGLTQGDGR